jgi:hypothetical protein
MVSLRYLEACIGKVREVDGTSISVRADKLGA